MSNNCVVFTVMEGTPRTFASNFVLSRICLFGPFYASVGVYLAVNGMYIAEKFGIKNEYKNEIDAFLPLYLKLR